MNPTEPSRGILDRPCLRCGHHPLMRTDSAADDVTFYECPGCGRRFTYSGGSLTERWPGPIGLALYGVLFDDHPQERAKSSAAGLGRLDRDRLVAEIRHELEQPSQQVRDILPGMRASEADLREFLALLVDELLAGPELPQS